MDSNYLVGKILDNQYQIEKLLGQGGMGAVYKARHVKLGDLVAIKVMPPHISSNPEYQKRFLREGQAARKFKHPNAITVHDLRETSDGMIYMVLEYIEGHNLREEINKKGLFTPKEALELIEPVANALNEAHAMGVVHRDIKPENIMVSRANGKTMVKLLDLGIAKIIDGKTALTVEGQVLGTPDYMSPEQWGILSPTETQSGKPITIDGRADIYSLGVIVYEMVTGQRPFTAATAQELAVKHITSTPLIAKDINPDVSEAFSRAIAQSIAKERENRPANCQKFIEQLKAGLDSKSSNTFPSSEITDVLINKDNFSTKSMGEAQVPDTLLIESRKGDSKYAIAGIAIIIVLSLLGLGIYNWQQKNNVTTSQTPSLMIEKPTPVAKVVEETEEQRYWNVVDKNSMEELKAYVDKYPNGTYANLAGTKIKNIETAGKAIAEEKYWEMLDKTRQEELKAYIAKYPNGAYVDLAKAKVNNLELAARPVETASNTSSSSTAVEPDPAVDRRMTGEFVRVPAGEFMMGSEKSDDEKPVHKVVISRSFEMGKYEVTQEQWEAVMGNNPSDFKRDGRLPVESVSWDDVQKFISTLNSRSRKYTYRLPTEAEWEYAARAGSRGDYAGNLDAMAWYNSNSGNKTHAVGGKQANAFGLYDMHGNVDEWCLDCRDYSSGTATDPSGANSGSIRVFRGGSWFSPAARCRSAYRYIDSPAIATEYPFVGFRLVRTSR